MDDSLEWPRDVSKSSPDTNPQTQPSQKDQRPPRPKLDTIMSVTSLASAHTASEQTPRATRNTPPDRFLSDSRPSNQNGGVRATHQRPQDSSGISSQVNNPVLSPISRRARRKSTFEPRLLLHPHLDAPASNVPPPNFASPLAQLFSPVVSGPPDGGFNGPTTVIGQRRASRRSGGDAQLAPGVALFRRRAMSGMLGTPGFGASALSTTPGEEGSKEPSETVSCS